MAQAGIVHNRPFLHTGTKDLFFDAVQCGSMAAADSLVCSVLKVTVMNRTLSPAL